MSSEQWAVGHETRNELAQGTRLKAMGNERYEKYGRFHI